MIKSKKKLLFDKSSFQERHIGPRDSQISEMLAVIGVNSLDSMVDATVPEEIRMKSTCAVRACSEEEVLSELHNMAKKNQIKKSQIGMGYHDTVTPAVILRNILENPGWYTAYTPYQPEIAQGRLEALINFQQMICDLTSMDLANASLLDEATAAAEAMGMIHRICKKDNLSFFIDNDCLPQTIAVIKTRANALGLKIQIGDPFADLNPSHNFGVLLQYPGVNGAIHDFTSLVQKIHEANGLVAVAADPLSLVLLRPPGEWGADIVIGNTQRFGVPLGFGGPHAAYIATREKYKRALPGRIIGVSVDRLGRSAFRMALQTREQHIRREKATSNVCTSQALLAIIAGMYAVWHGPRGIKRIAQNISNLTSLLACRLKKRGVLLLNKNWFDTLVIKSIDADVIHARASKYGFNLRKIDKFHIGVSINEVNVCEDIFKLVEIITGKADEKKKFDVQVIKQESGIPIKLLRSSRILQHPIFNTHQSETSMMRYLRCLEGKDLALNRAMIPLGSCTMKLNSAVEMIPITWPGFAKIHPFAPLEQVTGYLDLISRLETQLCDITGFFAVSLQPNAGSQGEYAGLLAILAYHKARGDDDRDICLIPASAHGTNPASAVMANMQIIVIECDKFGNIDLKDLKTKAKINANKLGALMVTYPSTHGVFEPEIKEICNIVHEHGGLVYMDGANFQAMVCVCKPGEFGPDVMHMNLHKTFCIPHGGGGPGVGPIGVVKRLAPYLPNHPIVDQAGPKTGIGAISSAPWGSAGILPISWAYIELMGFEGLKKATEVAILAANYVARCLEQDGNYKILFKGQGGFVAHECIIDTRQMQKEANITVDDISKRLIDYGFHGPTMSWPVMHTLMIEPTESEPKEELDRFIRAMRGIRHEIDKIQSGEWPIDDNPLVNAPHTAEMITTENWPHPYSRELAVFPEEELLKDKYWPATARINNEYGDKYLVCTCPSIDTFRTDINAAKVKLNN